MRNAFADEVTRLAPEDPRVVLLSGDIGNRLFDKLKAVGDNERHFLNCGVGEANMIGVAAGMAMSGLRPIVYTITPFTTTRVFEQIRVDLAYHEAPVIVVGTGSGLSYAALGPTHHSLEDMAILRTLPGFNVLAPCDSIEMRGLLRAALRQDRPTYIRIGKKGEPQVHADDATFEIGRAAQLRSGRDVAVLVAGVLAPTALKAAELCAEAGVSAEVMSFHSVKPLDVAYLEGAASRFKAIVTLEEHGRIGGLGGAVAEWRAPQRSAPPVLTLGAADVFLHEVGSTAYARGRYGLNAEQVAEAITRFLSAGR